MVKDKLWVIWSWKRFLIHIGLGTGPPMVFLSPMSTDAQNGLFWGIMGMVVVYQVLEEVAINDHSFKDVQGIIGGLFLAIPILWVLS